MATYSPVEVLTGVTDYNFNQTISNTNYQIILTAAASTYKRVLIQYLSCNIGGFGTGDLYLYKAAGGGAPEVAIAITSGLASGIEGFDNKIVFVPQGWSIAYRQTSVFSNAVDAEMTAFTYSMF